MNICANLSWDPLIKSPNCSAGIRVNRRRAGRLIDLMLSEVIAGHVLRVMKFFPVFAEPADVGKQRIEGCAVTE